MAAYSIHLSIIVQRALRQGSWVEKALLWNMRQHKCAKKQVPGRDLDLAEFRGLDGRRIEIGLTLFQSAQLAINKTMVSPSVETHREGRSCLTPRCGVGTSTEDEGGRARLVVLAAETAQFLRCLAKAKNGDNTVMMQNRVKVAWLRRWSKILACNATRGRPHPTSMNIPSKQEFLQNDRFG